MGPRCTGNLYKAVPRLRGCCRPVEAEEVSNSRNKIHRTWERPYRDSLYSQMRGCSRARVTVGVLYMILPRGAGHGACRSGLLQGDVLSPRSPVTPELLCTLLLFASILFPIPILLSIQCTVSAFQFLLRPFFCDDKDVSRIQRFWRG